MRCPAGQDKVLVGLEGMRPSKLVGRQKELQGLVEAFTSQHEQPEPSSSAGTATGAGGSGSGGHVAVIVGGPGEGKSRLAAEAVHVLYRRMWFREVRFADLGMWDVR